MNARIWWDHASRAIAAEARRSKLDAEARDLELAVEPAKVLELARLDSVFEVR